MKKICLAFFTATLLMSQISHADPVLRTQILKEVNECRKLSADRNDPAIKKCALRVMLKYSQAKKLNSKNTDKK